MSKRGFVAFALIVCCAVAWTVHTLLFVSQFLSGQEKTTTTRSSNDRQPLPTLLICNKFPFVQAGLDQLGASFNQQIVLQYLTHWLDHSFAASPDVVPLNSSSASSAESIISQTLLGDSFKQRLDSFLITCPNVLRRCYVQGVELSGSECCANHVKPYLATLQGLCFVFDPGNLTQQAFSVDQGIRLDFLIQHGTFEPIQHPGLKIFIRSPNLDAHRLATEIDPADAIHLTFSKHLISKLNVTSICTASEYDKCARGFLEMTRPFYWQTDSASSKDKLGQSLETCKSDSNLPCQLVNYRPVLTVQQLPASADLVASFAVSFDSTDSLHQLHEQRPSLLELFSFAGYNLALWFSVALLVWMCCGQSCLRRHRAGQKVVPGASLVQSAANSRPTSVEKLPGVGGRAILPPIGSVRSVDSGSELVKSMVLPSTSQA